MVALHLCVLRPIRSEMALKSIAWILSAFLVSASLCDLQDDAQVLEIFDQFDGKHLPSPMPDDTVCNFSNSSIEADIVKEAITVKNKPKESSLLSSDAALHIAKQLSSYISESAEGNMFYLVTQAIKGEKCDPGNEAMHVIHAVIKETDCDKKEIEEWGSHSGCRVNEHDIGHHCIWIGKVKESKVTENHGIFCESYSFFSSAQPLCQSLRYHNTGMLRVTPANAKFFEGSFVAYKPPDFSASYPKEKSFDDFDPSHKDGSIDRRPMDNKKYAVKDGRPLNPGGFTGLQGRGVHPRWGPNFMAIFVITRREGDKLEVLSTSSSLKPVSFPNFYVDNYDLTTLSSQLEKIILHSNSQNSHSEEEIKKIVKEAMHHSTLLKQGFTPDASNTDNSWLETVIVQISDQSRKHVGLLDLKPTESLNKVGWKLLDKTEQKNLLNTLSKAIGKDNLNEVAAEVGKKRFRKLLKALVVAGLIGKFLSGIGLVVSLVALVCTGSLLPVLGALGLLVAFSVLSLKQGFTPDASNTDNSWLETVIVQISDQSRKHVGLLDLKPTESLNKVGWKLLDKTEQKNLLNTISKAIGKDNLNEVAAEVERKRSKKISKALLVAGLIGRFFIGLSFVVAVVAFICTGSLLPVLGAVGLLVAFSVLSVIAMRHIKY
ncbi:ADP-ribose pyrophosphatase, mitochondrial [Trichinella sp. T8]|nr:ADP-ribose pyrophosphatase, mitochondrial [Trichinella sp. T8]